MAKKLKGDYLYCLGHSSNGEVCGSEYYINFHGKHILLDCGLYQSTDFAEEYRINSEKPKYNPADLDYIFISHNHGDHILKLYALYKYGFNGKIIMTPETAGMMESTGKNSAAILEGEKKALAKRRKKDVPTIYDAADVKTMMDYVETYSEYGVEIRLDDVVSFKMYKSAHIIGSVQYVIILKDENKTRKILYSGDLGRFLPVNHYVGEETETPPDVVNIALMEGTYGLGNKGGRRARKKDLDILKTAIDTTLKRGGSVIMPAFSQQRSQELMTELYLMYADDAEFKADIIVDSKLTKDICNDMLNLLSGADLSLWRGVMSWKRIRLISDRKDSEVVVKDKKPKVIISSSGFCLAGHVTIYLSEMLQDKNNTVIFSGFLGNSNNYLAYRIKNAQSGETIKINGRYIPCNADVTVLTTFSCHMPHDELVKYGAGINADKVYIVHADEPARQKLKEDIEREVSRQNKINRVILPTMGTAIKL